MAIVLFALAGTSEASEEEGRKLFDHDKQHCKDVSVWGEVQYKPAVCRVCGTETELKCNTRSERVCEQVPMSECRLVGYTECKMEEETVTYSETEVVTDGVFTKKECRTELRPEIHIKLEPRCRNVTRQDCVTKWELNSQGRKVWAGNEECRPVTWQKCELEEVSKEFNQTYTECFDSSEEIPTMSCRDRERTKTIMKTVCTAKAAMVCQCTNEEQCVNVSIKECSEVVRPVSCENKEIGRIPFQDKIHRVKCLLQSTRDEPSIGPEDNKEQGEARNPPLPGGDSSRRRRGGGSRRTGREEEGREGPGLIKSIIKSMRRVGPNL